MYKHVDKLKVCIFYQFLVTYLILFNVFKAKTDLLQLALFQILAFRRNKLSLN